MRAVRMKPAMITEERYTNLLHDRSGIVCLFWPVAAKALRPVSARIGRRGNHYPLAHPRNPASAAARLCGTRRGLCGLDVRQEAADLAVEAFGLLRERVGERFDIGGDGTSVA